MRRSGSGVVVFLLACDPGEVVLLAPETAGGAPSFSIRAVLDTPYTALADALGWRAGVPGAELRVHLMSEPYDSTYWHVATADSTGIATFSGLGGLYEVEVSRPLSDAEQGHVGGAVHVLAGGRRLYAAASGPVNVTMAPDHRGPLVFSEFMIGIPHDLYCAVYGDCSLDSRYFEVYNNGDTTVYLDGKYWGIGWNLNRDFPYWPCGQTGPVRNDPEGIWTRHVFRFPGRGWDYPLAPGQAAVVAQSAIDHRAEQPQLLDLTGADFEWGAHNSADNPEVPNLEDIGIAPRPYYYPSVSDMPEYLSDPVGLDTLPRYVDPYSGSVYVRIPRAVVLDAWAGTADYAGYGGTANQLACLEDLNRAFERLPGPAAAPTDWVMGSTLSFQRRVLTVLTDGRKVLQDTETSMADLVKAPITPGWIPDP